MVCIKQTWHPNAYLRSIRNVKNGLSKRTKILLLLDSQVYSAGKIARQLKLSYSTVNYHLHLLLKEGTIARKGKGRYVWLTTGFGQKRL